MAKTFNQELTLVLLAIESNLLGFIFGFSIYRFIKTQYDFGTFNLSYFAVLMFSFLASIYIVIMNTKLARGIKQRDWTYCISYIQPKVYQLVFYLCVSIMCSYLLPMAIVQFVCTLVLVFLVIAQLSRVAKFDDQPPESTNEVSTSEPEVQLEQVTVRENPATLNVAGQKNESPPPPYPIAHQHGFYYNPVLFVPHNN